MGTRPGVPSKRPPCHTGGLCEAGSGAQSRRLQVDSGSKSRFSMDPSRMSLCKNHREEMHLMPDKEGPACGEEDGAVATFCSHLH